MAEKFSYLLDFSTPIDADQYIRQVCSILQNKTLLLQIAFDFYDASNDDIISELDLFKLFQFYGAPQQGYIEMFERVLKHDITTMTKLFVWMKHQQQEEIAKKEQSG